MTARIDRDTDVQRGMVRLPIHHPSTNRLTLPGRDIQAKEPHFERCAIRSVALEVALS